ncbi:MAG: hypothetical protein M3Z01_00700 [Thermoproteota archaeon]|nr:hypothetical protein [Thermoproteota archaeon]
MVKTEKIRGSVLIAVALIGFLSYSYILFGTDYGIILMKLTAISIVGIIFFIIGWIGFTLSIDEKN